VLDYAKDLAAQGDGFLPDFEVPHASCHVPQRGATDRRHWHQ
jgi:hypothetical protein